MIPKIKTILYATGLGTHAPQVFRYAMSLAAQYDAKIVIVHALEPLGPTAKAMVEMYLPDDTLRSFQREGYERVMATVRDRLARFCREECGPDAHCEDRVADIRVLQGHPSDVILAEAAACGADLIVMGSHRHTAMGEMLLGTTAHQVTQRASLPVLLVRVPNE